MESECNSNYAKTLPEEILRKIFLQVDPKSLIAFRLVCKSWKSAVDNSPEYMRHFVFDVYGVYQFLDSTLANKVKNICFRRGLAENSDLFFDAIRGSVESVVVDFVERPQQGQDVINSRNSNRQAATLRRALTSCENLSGLKFASPNREFLRFLCEAPEEELLKIQHLTFNVQEINDNELSWMRTFVLKCFSLNSIEYYYERATPNLSHGRTLEVEISLTNLVIEHVDLYPGSLNKITLAFGNKVQMGFDSVKRSALMASTIRKNLEIDFGSTLFDIDSILALRRSGVILTEKNCRSLKKGFSSWANVTISRDDREFYNCFGQLEHFTILFSSNASYNDLDLLGRLKSLRKLHLVTETTPGIPEDVFASGLPTLTSLSLTKDIFSNPELSFASFYQWFPNLTRLELDRMTDIPSELVIYLTKVDSLRELSFKECPIYDDMLIRPCEVPPVHRPDPQDHKRLIVPAIAALRCLEKLTLTKCRLLTDNCLASGIQRCTSLKYLRLESSGAQFTHLGFAAILNGGCGGGAMTLSEITPIGGSKIDLFLSP